MPRVITFPYQNNSSESFDGIFFKTVFWNVLTNYRLSKCISLLFKRTGKIINLTYMGICGSRLKTKKNVLINGIDRIKFRCHYE